MSVHITNPCRYHVNAIPSLWSAHTLISYRYFQLLQTLNLIRLWRSSWLWCHTDSRWEDWHSAGRLPLWWDALLPPCLPWRWTGRCEPLTGRTLGTSPAGAAPEPPTQALTPAHTHKHSCSNVSPEPAAVMQMCVVWMLLPWLWRPLSVCWGTSSLPLVEVHRAAWGAQMKLPLSGIWVCCFDYQLKNKHTIIHRINVLIKRKREATHLENGMKERKHYLRSELWRV